MERVGIYAGTFDPVHDGHIELAITAKELLELSSVQFMVEKKPWGEKQPDASVQQREKMVSLAIDGKDDLELFPSKFDQFTIEHTLPELRVAFEASELYFIMGADTFLHMSPDSWPGLETIITPPNYIVVAERSMMTEQQISAHARSLGVSVAIIPNTLPHHASTDVRAQIHDKALWLPQRVADYIDENELYKS